MRSKSILLPPILAALLLLAVAVAGYVRTGDEHTMPARILMKNNGGNVLFAHAAHIRHTPGPCTDCHHEDRLDSLGAMDSVQPCGSCHPPQFDGEYIRKHRELIADKGACASCHHLNMAGSNFSHDEHEDYASDCTDCHHDAAIEPEPQNCADCHDATGDEAMPGLRRAVHQRCAGCHQDIFDDQLAGCSDCHAFSAPVPGDEADTRCSRCHDEPTEELIPTRMQAYHRGCLGCHEKMDAGPFGEGVCNQCHINK